MPHHPVTPLHCEAAANHPCRYCSITTTAIASSFECVKLNDTRRHCPSADRNLRRATAQVQHRPLAVLSPYLELLPAHPPADARPQRLRRRLLRCKPSRKALCRVLLPLTISPFRRP